MFLINNCPVYEVSINSDNHKIFGISLVEEPAIETEFLALSKIEDKITLSFQDDKHIVSGIALRANMPIYRIDDAGNGYYILFTPDVIEKFMMRYAKDRNAFNVTVNHEFPVDNCYVVESYLINKERGICPIEFSDIEDGSWYVSMKIENDAVWNEIKNNKSLKGFSIEAFSEFKPIQEELSKVEKPNGALNYLNSIIKIIK